MENLGKMQFWEPGAERPPGLHVNPCAAVVKDRPGCSPSDPEELRTKLRIIVDLKRSLVDLHVVEEDVDLGKSSDS